MRFSTYLIMSLISFQINANASVFNFSKLPTIQTQLAIEQMITVDHQCHYPFNPLSIISILIFKEKGLGYITQGKKRCAWHFAKEVKTTIRDSVVLPNYFKKKLLKDIEEAEKKKTSI